MPDRSLKELGLTKEISVNHVVVSEAVFPFARFVASSHLQLALRK